MFPQVLIWSRMLLASAKPTNLRLLWYILFSKTRERRNVFEKSDLVTLLSQYEMLIKIALANINFSNNNPHAIEMNSLALKDFFFPLGKWNSFP